MIENKKTVELYLDPQTYSEEEMIENIEQAVQEFSKKDVRVNIDLNEYGVYVVKLDYIDRDTYINKLKYKMRSNRKDRILKKHKEYQEIKYGDYKQTQLYKPY